MRLAPANSMVADSFSSFEAEYPSKRPENGWNRANRKAFTS
jgi:hypothetical protein